MPHRARQSKTDKGILIPDSYEFLLRCDMSGCESFVQLHVKGFSDAMRALRHLKGKLVADSGWVLVTSKKSISSSIFVCPKHKREI